MATNGSFGQQEQYKGSLEGYPAAPASTNTSRTEEENGKLTNDQVGWYFVEQYYTTLSKNPEKLHLFYGKQSQFVYGLEAEVANVSVGRQDIQERIKQLDFQDCKVRVSNVDSQASMNNIVIQVIGETSNKAQEPKKFVQTFVLAQQPSGYFVLNDILRYINEDVEEEAEAEAAPAPVDGPVDAPAPAPAAEAEPVKVEAPSAGVDAGAVDEKLEKSKETPAVNGDAEEAAPAKAAEAPVVAEATTATEPDAAAEEVAEEESKEAEKPKEPTPTPAAKPAAPEAAPAAPAAPAEPAAPPKPMTWASRAAAAAGPRPVVPLPKTATPPAPAQNRAPAPAAPPAAAAAAPAATPAATQAAPAPAPAKEGSEWQTAGGDSKRQNRPQSVSGNSAEKEGTMGYVKYVTDKVQDSELKSALAAHGELTYFDINRQKNCAFVEYKTIEGYNAAIAASPFTVSGENIVIEPRRPKANAYGGSSYGSGRGGASGRGRGGYDGRSGNNSRGNFGGQGRGRGGAARGRGGAQSSNA